ncbi:hypothetical protein Lal_00040470 [Lupinus albus]|nr:hypothetical protein Lal_00040470 [Lupinus albus]
MCTIRRIPLCEDGDLSQPMAKTLVQQLICHILCRDSFQSERRKLRRLILDSENYLDLEKCLYVPECVRKLVYVARLDCTRFNFKIRHFSFNFKLKDFDKNSAYLWHKRLDHIYKEMIMRLTKSDILPLGFWRLRCLFRLH